VERAPHCDLSKLSTRSAQYCPAKLRLGQRRVHFILQSNSHQFRCFIDFRISTTANPKPRIDRHTKEFLKQTCTLFSFFIHDRLISTFCQLARAREELILPGIPVSKRKKESIDLQASGRFFHAEYRHSRGYAKSTSYCSRV